MKKWSIKICAALLSISLFGQTCLPLFAEEMIEDNVTQEEAGKEEVEKIETEEEMDEEPEDSKDTIRVEYRDWSTEQLISTKEMDISVYPYEDWTSYQFSWIEQIPSGYDVAGYFSEPQEAEDGYSVQIYCAKVGDTKEIALEWDDVEEGILPSITVEIKESYFDEMSFYFMYLEALENSIPEGYIYKYHERVELNKIVACMQKGSVEVDSTATVQYINFETKEVMETIKNVPFQIVQYEYDSYTESEMQLGWVETQNNYDAYYCEHFNTYEEVNGEYVVKYYAMQSGMTGDIYITYCDPEENDIETKTVPVTIPENVYDFWQTFETAARENVPEGYIMIFMGTYGVTCKAYVEQGDSINTTIDIRFIDWKTGEFITSEQRDLEVVSNEYYVEHRYFYGLEDYPFTMPTEVNEEDGNYSVTVLCANYGESKTVNVTYQDVNSDYSYTRKMEIHVPEEVEDMMNSIDTVYQQALLSVPEGEWMRYELQENGDIIIYFGMPVQTIKRASVNYIEFGTNKLLCSLEDVELQLWDYDNRSHKYYNAQIVDAQPYGFDSDAYYMDYFGTYTTSENQYTVNVYCFKPNATGEVSCLYTEERPYGVSPDSSDYLTSTLNYSITVPSDILETKNIWDTLYEAALEHVPAGYDMTAMKTAAINSEVDVIHGYVEMVPMKTNLRKWEDSSIMDQMDGEFLYVHYTNGHEEKRVDNWDWFLPEFYNQNYEIRIPAVEPEFRNGQWQFDVYFGNPGDVKNTNVTLKDITKDTVIKTIKIDITIEDDDIEQVWEAVNEYIQGKNLKEDYVLEFVNRVNENEYVAQLVPGKVIGTTSATVTCVDWESGEEIDVIENVPLEILELREENAQQNVTFRLGQHHSDYVDYAAYDRLYYVNYVELEDGTYSVDEICVKYNTEHSLLLEFEDEQGNALGKDVVTLNIRDYEGADPYYGSLDNLMQKLTLPQGYYVKYYDQTARYGIKVVLGHEKVETSMLQGYTVSLDGSVSLTAYFKFDTDVLLDETSKVVFTINGKQTTKDVQQIESRYTDPETGDIYFGYKVEVPAKEMTDNISCQVVSSQVDTPCFNISIQQYAKYILEHDGYSNVEKDIAQALLTYGYYSQQYFNYQMGDLPDSQFVQTMDGQVDFSPYQYQLSDTNADISFVGGSLVLASRPKIKLYFSGNVALEVLNLDQEEVVQSQEGKYNVLTISNISKFDKIFEIQGKDFSMSYGIYSYGYQAQKGNKTQLVQLLQSIQSLNNAVSTYS